MGGSTWSLEGRGPAVLLSSLRVLDSWVSWNACPEEEDLPDSLLHSADKVSQAAAEPGAGNRE